MAKSPHHAVQFGTPLCKPAYYPDPPREPYVEISGGEVRSIATNYEASRGPCRTCRWSEGMAGKVYEVGPPAETMKCRRNPNMLVLRSGTALGGCKHWEREPGADDA